jgi:hypothetical protein
MDRNSWRDGKQSGLSETSSGGLCGCEASWQVHTNVADDRKTTREGICSVLFYFFPFLISSIGRKFIFQYGSWFYVVP